MNTRDSLETFVRYYVDVSIYNPLLDPTLSCAGADVRAESFHNIHSLLFTIIDIAITGPIITKLREYEF